MRKIRVIYVKENSDSLLALCPTKVNRVLLPLSSLLLFYTFITGFFCPALTVIKTDSVVKIIITKPKPGDIII